MPPVGHEPGPENNETATRDRNQHVFNLFLRAGTGVLIWMFCLAAFFAGTVRAVNLQGVSIACAFIVVTCVASYFAMRKVRRGTAMGTISAVDRFFVIAGYTGVVYSLGGIEATYLSPLYALFTMYIGFASPWRQPYTTAFQSTLCLTFIVAGEHYGVIPSFKVDPSFGLAWNYQLAILAVTAGFLFVSAFISSAAARLIDEGRRRLTERNIELEHARDRAQESDRKKSEFLANMSHELRTPLNHVIGFTELLLEERESRLDESQKDSLGEVLSSAQHLLSLINDVLDTAKVEAGKVELERTVVELPVLLQRCLAAGKQTAVRRGIKVLGELDGVPPRAWVDERRLLQVLFNVLENAVKFSSTGAQVVLRAWESAPGVLDISVSDSGVGIKSEDLERIFLPFERAEGELGSRFPGTGLGLSMARKLVELHGGRIWAESAGEGTGATFRLTLPITVPVTVPAGA